MKKMICIFILSTFIVCGAFPQNKTALVIGNGNYSHFGRLTHPISEAREMSEALERLGFDVTLVLNGTQGQMDDALYDFETKLKRRGGLALFHYGGHGVQVNGSNYLIPVDSLIPDERRVRSRALDVDEVIGAMDASGAQTNIVILDACRDNPLPAVSRSTNTRGLAVVGQQPPDSIIVYSASAGSTAQDGLFTPTLLKYLEVPGLEFSDMLRKVRTEVRVASNGTQRTGDYNQLESEVYLKRNGNTVLENNTTPTNMLNISSNPTVVQDKRNFDYERNISSIIEFNRVNISKSEHDSFIINLSDSLSSNIHNRRFVSYQRGNEILGSMAFGVGNNTTEEAYYEIGMLFSSKYIISGFIKRESQEYLVSIKVYDSDAREIIKIIENDYPNFSAMISDSDTLANTVLGK